MSTVHQLLQTVHVASLPPIVLSAKTHSLSFLAPTAHVIPRSIYQVAAACLVLLRLIIARHVVMLLLVLVVFRHLCYFLLRTVHATVVVFIIRQVGNANLAPRLQHTVQVVAQPHANLAKITSHYPMVVVSARLDTMQIHQPKHAKAVPSCHIAPPVLMQQLVPFVILAIK